MEKLMKIPIWNRKLLIVVEPSNVPRAIKTHKLGRRLMAQIKNDPPVKNCCAMIWMCDYTGRYILYFPKKPTLATIVHETNHIVKHMMKYICAQQEKEAHAYTQDYLFKEIRDFLNTKDPP